MKPIIFSTLMVQAILAGRKTQTRRVCKAIENYDFGWGLDREPYISDYKIFAKVAPRKWDNVTLKNVWLYDLQTAVDESKTCILKPPYQPGDILWVRETWAEAREKYYYKADKKCIGFDDYDCLPRNVEYHETCDICEYSDGYIKWRSPMFMPREAARLFLKVTSVKVERLQDITEEDAKAEGVICGQGQKRWTARSAFMDLWDRINGKNNPWESNPWVWVIEFERINKEEAERLEGLK